MMAVPVLPVAFQLPVEGLNGSEGMLMVSPIASTSPFFNNAAFGLRRYWSDRGSGPRSCRWIIQLDADVMHREDLAVGKYR